MKISKSKQELARIISENGGWRDGAEWAAQQQIVMKVEFWRDSRRIEKTKKPENEWVGYGHMGYKFAIPIGKLLPNWHQSALSRAEYYHLYPAPDADGWIECATGEAPVSGNQVVDVKFRDRETDFGHSNGWNWSIDGSKDDIIAYRMHTEKAKTEFCESVVRSIPEPDEQVWTNPPSIEQLMQTYTDRANSLQLANEHLATCTKQANEAMEALSVACKAAGFDISPITAKQEPELVIADWRDLQENDWIWYGGDVEHPAGEYRVLDVEVPDHDGCRAVLVDTIGDDHWIDIDEAWRFIRRP